MGRALLALGTLVVTISPSSAQTDATEDNPKGSPQTRIQLESLLVEGKRSPAARTIPSRSQAREELRTVPGNTQLIGSETYRKERVGNLETVLENAAGVYIQSRFGGSETRFSIRGSGITQTFESRGVRILRNGLPLTQADGFTRTQLVDPLIIQRAEVLPGANALEYGVATLGGAVNLVTPTGYTADRLSAHLEGGSDAWGRAQIASGQVLGRSGLDYYASLSGLHQDGFREANDDEESGQFYGNVGFRSSEDTEHRLHLTYLQQDLELPGSLTEEQIEDNPEQPNELWQRSRSQRNFDILRFDWQTSTRLGEATTVDLGASWQHEDMFHPLPAFQFGPGTADSQIIKSDRDDFSVNARAKSSLEASDGFTS